MTAYKTARRGMSLPELLIVVGIAAILFALVLPKIGTARDGASKRAARQELAAAFAATRASALQKGKTATLTLTSTSASVAVLSGISGISVNVWGPIRFNTTLNASVEALSGAPTSISYNARGVLTPTPAGTLKYRVSVGALKDTLCISPAGIILGKGCTL